MKIINTKVVLWILGAQLLFFGFFLLIQHHTVIKSAPYITLNVTVPLVVLAVYISRYYYSGKHATFSQLEHRKVIAILDRIPAPSALSSCNDLFIIGEIDLPLTSDPNQPVIKVGSKRVVTESDTSDEIRLAAVSIDLLKEAEYSEQNPLLVVVKFHNHGGHKSVSLTKTTLEKKTTMQFAAA